MKYKTYILIFFSFLNIIIISYLNFYSYKEQKNVLLNINNNTSIKKTFLYKEDKNIANFNNKSPIKNI